MWFPPSAPTAPPPTRRPVLRSVTSGDEDIRPRPAIPHPFSSIMVNANNGPTIPPPAPAAVPPVAARSFDPSNSPREDYIPIAHDHMHAQTRAAPLPTAVVIPPTPSDDGFTPITPTPASPRLRGFRLSRAPPLPLPRDALGIPIGQKFVRAKSRRVQIAHVDDDNNDDTTPLSPTADREAGLGDGSGVQTAAGKPKPKLKRKTLWGVIEGWWDLGLLERGKSLRRKV